MADVPFELTQKNNRLHLELEKAYFHWRSLEEQAEEQGNVLKRK